MRQITCRDLIEFISLGDAYHGAKREEAVFFFCEAVPAEDAPDIEDSATISG